MTAPADFARVLRARLRQPHELLRQLVVGEALAERPRRRPARVQRPAGPAAAEPSPKAAEPPKERG